MTHRNLLLLGLSSIALQGCIAAAAIPIVASGGALVRDSVSDDARAGTRERVTVVPSTGPITPAPTPTPTPALAAATPPPEPVAAMPEPVDLTPTPTPLATPASEPVIVATLGDAPQGPSTQANATPVTTAMALPAASEEPLATAPDPAPPSQAVVVARLPEEPVASAPEPAAPAEELAMAAPVEEPAAPVSEPPVEAPIESLAAAPVLETPSESIADVGLPPEPAAPQTVEAPALAAAAPVEEPAAPAVTMPSEPESEELAATSTVATPVAAAPVPTPAPTPAPAETAVAGSPLGPTPPVAAAMPAFRPPTNQGYAAFRSYALTTLSGGLPLPSAMLADPTSLQPIRRECQGNAPTVVIDLDPAGGLVPLAGPLALNSELGRILEELRMRDVQIAWITDRGPIDARRVRDRLVAAGLDPDSDDALYVERYPGETKQARRAALAQTQCVIALVGDERSDFDDLYNYIIDPSDAAALNPLLGNGWFLIDNPVGQ